MTAPLTSWTCDVCGKQITDPEHGLVLWQELQPSWENGNPPQLLDPLVAHKSMGNFDCDPGIEGGYELSLEISGFLGETGRARLLSFLSQGPLLNSQIEQTRPRITNFDSFVDLYHRMQTPWYENARINFDTSIAEEMLGNDPVHPFTPDRLREFLNVIERAN